MPSQDLLQTARLGQLLYVSALSPGVPVTEVSRIVTSSRLRNTTDAITGLLVFDGDTFCQYVEGPPKAVDALLGRLLEDRRHQEMEILIDGTFEGERRFSDWRLGYVDSFENDELAALHGLHGDAAIACFLKLVPKLDVEV